MLSFSSDYMQGAHEAILDRMLAANRQSQPGYGEDAICESAKARIREACATPQAFVRFLVGGTQTNRVVISSILKPFEGVVAAKTGHVALHEAGAIEASGHKVLEVPSYQGKLKLEDVKRFFETFWADGNHEHMVFPGMVYISQPTEYGTLYSLAELKALHAYCQEQVVPLYIDGARLGYGLASPKADFTLADIAHSCDVFYIGGTKVGALFGEAVVFPKGDAPAHFVTFTKREGAMLAKGWLLGLQFDTLFTDDLYMRISRNAIEQAMRARSVLQAAGFRLFIDSPTNQQFVEVENSVLERLQEKVGYGFWERTDAAHTVVRFATSWATSPEDVDALEKILKEIR